MAAIMTENIAGRRHPNALLRTQHSAAASLGQAHKARLARGGAKVLAM